VDAPQSADIWASGAAYEPYIGCRSGAMGRHFLAWLAVPSSRRWLDVAYGTGALTQSVLEICSSFEVVGFNPSAAYVAYGLS
jgi:ubiquinone/menaquinone biosynthesis C-methylase UbiE